jgi:digeranylgeranylglycerophospholipid reductase
VSGLLFENGHVSGVKVNHLGQRKSIRARVVIGADGVESRVGRWAGLVTKTKPADLESCVQMTLANVSIDPETVYFYFGRETAPGGYLWIFPKGPDMANVGLGISGTYSKDQKAITYLKNFVDTHFPEASCLTLVAGGVPTVATLKQIVTDGLLLAGDAAHQANPISGGGLLTGMIAGRIAGQVSADAVLKGDVSEKKLQPYVRQWMKAEGRNNEIFDRIRHVITRLSDDDLNDIAKIVSDIPVKKRTIFGVFKVALVKHPKLILEAAKLFR